MSTKLLKRLERSALKIKDPAVRQLIVDAREELLNYDVKLAEAQTGLVSGYYEGDYPTFHQGPPTTELETLVTAEECARMVATLKHASLQPGEELKPLPKFGDLPLKDVEEMTQTEVSVELLGMVKLMEQAGFKSICELYKSPKYKLPLCIVEERSPLGVMVAFNVTLDDGTCVTIRNAEAEEDNAK